MKPLGTTNYAITEPLHTYGYIFLFFLKFAATPYFLLF